MLNINDCKLFYRLYLTKTDIIMFFLWELDLIPSQPSRQQKVCHGLLTNRRKITFFVSRNHSTWRNETGQLTIYTGTNLLSSFEVVSLSLSNSPISNIEISEQSWSELSGCMSTECETRPKKAWGRVRVVNCLLFLCTYYFVMLSIQ